jgi:hypothetical protein
MKILPITLFCLFTLSILATVPAAQKRYGILPLRSTRAEVESRLGTSKSECKCFYELPRERIFIKYSSGSCDDQDSNGWNVPRDTVVSFEVFPKTKILFSRLKVDTKAFIKTEDTELPGAFYYRNESDGIGIEVDNDIVGSFYYGPTAKDSTLRCKAAQ